MKKIFLLFLEILLMLGVIYYLCIILLYLDPLKQVPFVYTVSPPSLILGMCLLVLEGVLVYLSHKWLVPLKFLDFGYLK